MSEHKIPKPDQSRSRARLIFGALFVAIYLAALLPPVYIQVTRLHAVFLGLPVSIWYMLLVSGSAVAVCAALYTFELARGELD